MRTPAFTVVVPAYNSERTLPDTLASIAAQACDDYEIVVVDDGSTDTTGAVADRLVPPDRGRVIHQANRGLPGARNAGIAAARGRWIALLDADDLWLPNYLGRMRELLESAEDVGFAFCDAYIYDERRRRIARRTAFQRYRPASVPTEPRALYLALLETNFAWVSACVPREVFDTVGGFDERLRACEDWNMWLRIAASGRRGIGTRECLGLYRHSAGQMHADLDRMLTGWRDAARFVLETATLDDGLRAATERRAQRTQAVLEAGGHDPRWRRALRPLVEPTRGVKDFRRRAPAEVSAAFPQLLR